MSKINILDDHLTNMIAAGEVVERPMGVVKELVENSIDAGATKIEVRLINGGLDSIEIIDDGCGMDKRDATAAFNRHATSKISQESDLWQIHTMGFRGEALPSIASVSKVTMTTNDGNDSTLVRIEYGKIMEAKPIGCSEGTSIKVEGLFYKTPARLKHLKSGNAELNAILDLIQKIALSHPEIAFELYNDDRLKISTNGSGSLQEAILAIYGLEIAKKAIPFNVSDFDFDVEGYIIAPMITRSTKQYIYSFINGRVIKSFGIQKAVIEGYSGYMMPDRYPVAVLNVSTDFKLVDVNVHPSKWEIRLSKEKQLYALISEGIKNTLKEYMIPSDMLLERAKPKPIEDPYQNVRVEEIKQEEILPIEPIIVEENKTEEQVNEHETFTYTPPKQQPPKTIVQQELLDYTSGTKIERFNYLAQFHGNYILAYDEENLYVVDQHAAQERCMYEDICDQIMENSIVSQPLLIPLVIDVSPAIINQLDKINEVLSCIKLEFEQFSLNSIVTREVPDFFEEIDEVNFVHQLIDEIINDKQMNMIDIKKDRIATTACHSSVRFNHHLTVDESKKLLSRLSNCKQPFNCPHGRPTMISISEKQLIKEFKRV